MEILDLGKYNLSLNQRKLFLILYKRSKTTEDPMRTKDIAKELYGEECKLKKPLQSIEYHVIQLRKRINPDYKVENISKKGYRIIKSNNELM